MDYLYIDEKGPQETIRVTSPYNDEKKIKLGITTCMFMICFRTESEHW